MQNFMFVQKYLVTFSMSSLLKDKIKFEFK